MNIQGQAAIVAGGASGLGKATVRLLLEKGAKVAVFDNNAEKGEALAQELGVLFAQVDITDEDSVRAGLKAADKAQGPSRILVNTAAIGGLPIRTVGKDGPYPMEIFRRTVEINFIGAFNITRLAAVQMVSLPPLERGERGVLINVASANAHDQPVGNIAYNASKAAVAAMTLSLTRDLAPKGIRACTISPGNFETPMLMAAPPQLHDSLLAITPFPNDRLGDPDDFAAMACHICENVMLNGETIRLDAGVRHSHVR